MTMNDALSPQNADTLDAERIIAWLKQNPDFLKQNPEACDFLIPPTINAGRGVADFQSYMIERLKADKSEAVEVAREIVESARSNMNNQTRIHRAVLRVLDAESFDEFLQIITHDLSTLLNVDITTLVVETSGRAIPHIHTSGIRIVPDGTINSWMQNKTILLQENIGGIEAIYGPGATLVRSQALVRIDISQKTPPAILAFGSRDPHTFHPQQGTELVGFLARVVENEFRSWLMLPS
jgi:uncharacterized protein